jgi:hypothetical protein
MTRWKEYLEELPPPRGGLEIGHEQRCKKAPLKKQISFYFSEKSGYGAMSL